MFENYVLCDNQQSKHLNKNKMGYIYKITNKINNKIYIGKTENSIQHRFQEHIKTRERVAVTGLIYILRCVSMG